MDDLHKQFDKFIFRVALHFSEIFSYFLLSVFAVFGSLLIIYARKYGSLLLSKIGITYFIDRLNTIRDINSDLIWIQGALRADVYAIFRTFNGKSYIEDNSYNPHDTGKKKIVNVEKIIARIVNSKPTKYFPDYLDVDVYKQILSLSVSNDWQIISYDYIKKNEPTSKLLVFMELQGIENLFSYRIWDIDKKTYGIILFTWSKSVNIDSLFDRTISKKLDSVSIRFQNYVSSSILEKVGIRKFI